jgi:DNA-binding transcriptional ArsR family regulator
MEHAMAMGTPRVKAELLRGKADSIAATLKLLANTDRMLLLCKLSEGERCVGELEEELDIHQPTLSQQLGVLRNEEVVATRKEGKNVFYSISDPAVMKVIAALYRIYCTKE